MSRRGAELTRAGLEQGGIGDAINAGHSRVDVDMEGQIGVSTGRRSRRRLVGPWLFRYEGKPIIVIVAAMGAMTLLCTWWAFDVLRDLGAAPVVTVLGAATVYVTPGGLAVWAARRSGSDARLWFYLALEFAVSHPGSIRLPSRRKGWGTSGQLTAAAYRRLGIKLPDNAAGQYGYGGAALVRFEELEALDLLFWGTGTSPGSIDRVGIYAGNSTVVVGDPEGSVVRVLPLSAPLLGVPLGVVSHRTLRAGEGAGTAPGHGVVGSDAVVAGGGRRRRRGPIVGPWLFRSGGAPITWALLALGAVSVLCFGLAFWRLSQAGAGPIVVVLGSAAAYLAPAALIAWAAADKSEGADARLWAFLAQEVVLNTPVMVLGIRRWESAGQFTAAAYGRLGIDLPVDVATQYHHGGAAAVSGGAVEAGDLMFWGILPWGTSPGSIDTAGIYVGDSNVVLADPAGDGVQVVPLSSPLLRVPLGVVSRRALTGADATRRAGGRAQ